MIGDDVKLMKNPKIPSNVVSEPRSDKFSPFSQRHVGINFPNLEAHRVCPYVSDKSQCDLAAEVIILFCIAGIKPKTMPFETDNGMLPNFVTIPNIENFLLVFLHLFHCKFLPFLPLLKRERKNNLLVFYPPRTNVKS